MRLGIAHHLGWAVAVTASAGHDVVDRRRIELIEPGLPNAPVHHHGGAHAMHTDGPPPSDDELAALVADVRASATRASAAALDELEAAVGGPIRSISLRDWPDDVPDDIATQRRAPHESRVDSIMYREVLADLAAARGWEVHRYAADAEQQARRLLGARADEVLQGPRTRLGAPWTKDHRTALAATVLATGLAS